MKRCVTCLELKDEIEFNWRWKSMGIRQKTCRLCQKGHRRTWYENHKKSKSRGVKVNRYRVRDETRDYVWDYLATHPCVSCGESDPTVLEFDHLHGRDKDIAVLAGQGYSLSRIQKEIQKTQVLCANFTGEKHQKRGDGLKNRT